MPPPQQPQQHVSPLQLGPLTSSNPRSTIQIDPEVPLSSSQEDVAPVRVDIPEGAVEDIPFNMETPQIGIPLTTSAPGEDADPTTSIPGDADRTTT